MRPSWDSYFMGIAKLVAERATCDRAHVGAVLVRDRRIISSGYNGSLPGQAHCNDVGHLMVDGHCVRVNHAELNLIAQAALHGEKTEGTTCYVTHHPCLNCLKLLISSGVSRIVYGETYRVNEIPTEFMKIIQLDQFINVILQGPIDCQPFNITE